MRRLAGGTVAIALALALLPLGAAPVFAAAKPSDFNGDGYADLAIGVQNQTVNTYYGAGAVQILYGGPSGLTIADQVWTKDDIGLDMADESEHFGSALAAGDFDGDGFADLAIGAPLDTVSLQVSAGSVTVLFGSPIGLTEDGARFLTQDASGISDSAETYEYFGDALAAGDLNGDGRWDLAIGVPNETVGVLEDAGAVHVLMGTSGGLSGNDAFWTQDSVGVNDVAEDSDYFGFSLAIANFGKSSYGDLAIGAPGETVGGDAYAGAVSVLYGSSTGLTTTGDQFWTQDSPDINDTAEMADRFGWSLAAANFGKSSHADLAIGIMGEAIGTVDQAGAVAVIYGSSTGLTATGDQFWHQNSTGIAGTSETSDLFGWSLAAANFGKSSEADLAIGVPLEDLGLVENAGMAHVIYGSSTGLTATGNQTWSQDASGIADAAETGDTFGSALAAANFGSGSQADLAVGVPYEALDGKNQAGAVHVVYGSSTGLQASNDDFWHRGVAGILGDLTTSEIFGSALAPPGGGHFVE